jgi:GMP synthase (glutamine-hydrolysing)
MKPFLLLASRAEDVAAEDEYEAYLRYGGLEPPQLQRIRLEQGPLPELDLDDYSGVIVGGSPFTSSDPPEKKSETQHRVERELAGLLDRIVAEDFPFLGACYGVGVLGTLRGGVVDRTYAEPISARTIALSEEGRADQLLGTMPPTFAAFLGHKEAVRRLPDGAVLLASSADCPVHAFRIGRNVYATQFHPELDEEGLVLRIHTYRDYGYFDPPEAAGLIAMARASHVEHPPRLLARFVELFSC